MKTRRILAQWCFNAVSLRVCTQVVSDFGQIACGRRRGVVWAQRTEIVLCRTRKHAARKDCGRWRVAGVRHLMAIASNGGLDL